MGVLNEKRCNIGSSKFKTYFFIPISVVQALPSVILSIEKNDNYQILLLIFL